MTKLCQESAEFCGLATIWGLATISGGPVPSGPSVEPPCTGVTLCTVRRIADERVAAFAEAPAMAHPRGGGRHMIIDRECDLFFIISKVCRTHGFLRIFKVLMNFKNKIRYREKLQIEWKSLMQTYWYNN